MEDSGPRKRCRAGVLKPPVVDLTNPAGQLLLEEAWSGGPGLLPRKLVPLLTLAPGGKWNSERRDALQAMATKSRATTAHGQEKAAWLVLVKTAEQEYQQLLAASDTRAPVWQQQLFSWACLLRNSGLEGLGTSITAWQLMQTRWPPLTAGALAGRPQQTRASQPLQEGCESDWGACGRGTPQRTKTRNSDFAVGRLLSAKHGGVLTVGHAICTNSNGMQTRA